MEVNVGGGMITLTIIPKFQVTFDSSTSALWLSDMRNWSRYLPWPYPLSKQILEPHEEVGKTSFL